MKASGAVRDRPVSPTCDRPFNGNRLPQHGVKTPSSAASSRGQQARQDEQLTQEIQSKRAARFSRPTLQSDVQRIVELYRRAGRTTCASCPRSSTSRTIASTSCSRSTRAQDQRQGDRVRRQFGAYSGYRLRDVIKTGQSSILSFLKTTILRSRPNRVGSRAAAPLLSQERLCGCAYRFGRRRVRSRRQRLRPDFTIDEGDRLQFRRHRHPVWRARTSIPHCCAANCASPPRHLHAELLEKAVEEMTIEMSKRGYALRPCARAATVISRRATSTSCSSVEEGARAYIERIQCARQHAYPRLRDPAQFDIAEGDATTRFWSTARSAAEESRILRM